MSSKNIFDGENEKAFFAQEIYDFLKTGKWFTNEDIMAKHLNIKKEELPTSVSKCEYYGELKKAFLIVRKTIQDKYSKDYIETKQENKKKHFRYTGPDNDPLADMRNARTISDLKEYWKFCQDSAGFFPTSWLEYFFRNCQDLISINRRKSKGEQIISTNIDRILTNIEYLPIFYEAITNKTALKFKYHPFNKDEFEFIFHPQFLKEFNGRWFIFGETDIAPIKAFNIALDRISSKPVFVNSIKYIPAEKGFYQDFFNDIVGVTHESDQKVENIIIRTKSLNIHGLMITKPIHQSQKEVTAFGEHENGNYGEISLQVCINNELIGKILTYGKGLEVIAPTTLRMRIKGILEDQIKAYNND